MGEVGKVQVVWTGFVGAPAYSSHYFYGDPLSTSTAQDYVSAVSTFWNSIVGGMPSTAHFSVTPDVQILDEASGHLVRVETTTPPTQTATGNNGPYAAGVGCSVIWNTAIVHRGKRLRGRSFIIPLSGGSYDGNGNILDTLVTAYRTAAGILAAQAGFGVYGRPVSGAGGVWSQATGGTMKDQVSWLTTRRK